MAAPVEILNISSQLSSTGPTVPVNNAVLGTTADTEMDRSLYGWLSRTEYMTFAAGTTHIMSTAAYLDRLIVIPVSTGAGVVTLSDGTTAIMSIPAASHAIDPHTYSVPLGIRNTSTAGFKIVLGASVSAIAVGGFVGAKTTA
jgi:hypothetical protein